MNLRVSVVGTTCSGKTTLARRIACQWDNPHVELDAIHWQANWTPPPIEEFRSAAETVAAGDEWVIDGNYSAVRDIVWSRATDVVWLNLPLMTVLWRAILRTGRRVITGEELWAGNRETVSGALFSRDGIPWYVLRSYHRRRRVYRELLHPEEDLGFIVHEVCDSSRAKALLDSLLMRSRSSP